MDVDEAEEADEEVAGPPAGDGSWPAPVAAAIAMVPEEGSVTVVVAVVVLLLVVVSVRLSSLDPLLLTLWNLLLFCKPTTPLEHLVRSTPPMGIVLPAGSSTAVPAGKLIKIKVIKNI